MGPGHRALTDHKPQHGEGSRALAACDVAGPQAVSGGSSCCDVARERFGWGAFGRSRPRRGLREKRLAVAGRRGYSTAFHVGPSEWHAKEVRRVYAED